jgi:iron-sulfur cluster assembly protein
MVSIVNITPRAAERIVELANANSGQHLRLSVVKSGCSGNRYDMTFVDKAGAADERVSDNGADILVDPQSLFKVFGMTIDWKEDKFGRQFSFENPQEAGRCGCGESFHV